MRRKGNDPEKPHSILFAPSPFSGEGVLFPDVLSEIIYGGKAPIGGDDVAAAPGPPYPRHNDSNDYVAGRVRY